MIGHMAMPANFKYRDVFLKGQPAHRWCDSFRLRHPAMDCGRRAKIFAPFDALAGFDDALADKEVLYAFRRELSDDDREELDRRLGILRRLTRNSRVARENSVPVEITRYIPCADPNNAAFGYRGQYVKTAGICRRIGPRSITVDETAIPLADIVEIESSKVFEGRNIFDFR